MLARGRGGFIYGRGGFMVRPYGGRYGGRGPRKNLNNQQATTTVIFNDGDQINVPGPYNGQGSLRGYRRGPKMRGGVPRGYRVRRGRMRSRSENNTSSHGEEDHNDQQDIAMRNQNIPSRPLTRVVARARARSLSAGKQQEVNGSNATAAANTVTTGGLPDRDAYRMEVNEYVTRNGGNERGQNRTIPCVTVRDMHTFVPDRKQRRIWVPVAVCDELVKSLKKCKGDENVPYDVSKLEAQVFVCPVTKKVVEIEKVNEMVRLRTYMDVPKKDDFKEGDLVEVIELRNELMGRLVKFLDDVATRYRKVSATMSIPSLYSYSGERRFYYDLRETRWGLRLHISQVTDLHRNVIGIPLESVIDFRDRLNQVIDFLNLGGDEANVLGGRQRTASGRKKAKKSRNQRRRSYSDKAKDKKGAASAEEDTAKTETDDKAEGKEVNAAANEKGAAGDVPQQSGVEIAT